MPFDLRLTNGDLVVDPFDLQLNNAGLEAVAQRLTITLNTFKGEFFLNTKFGTPYYQVIFRKSPSLAVIDSELRKVIIGVTGVLQLISYKSSINRANRSLSVEFRARVEDGIVDANLDLGPEVLCIYNPPAGDNIIFIQSGPNPSLPQPASSDIDFNC